MVLRGLEVMLQLWVTILVTRYSRQRLFAATCISMPLPIRNMGDHTIRLPSIERSKSRDD
jgi:hypothetical protein